MELTMKTFVHTCLSVTLVCTLSAFAQSPTASAAGDQDATILPTTQTPDQWPVIESLRRESEAALDRGYEWLRTQQNENGAWSNPAMPALTGLAVWALTRDPEINRDAIERGVDYLLRCVQENGGIYVEPSEKRRGGGLANYNTAICMVALYQTGRSDVVPIVQRAREFIAKTQHLEDDMYYGGMGYDASNERAYADLSNSYMAYEAMRLTERVEDFRTDGERVDLDWDAALQFVQRLQNLPEYNDATWVNDTPANRGGFIYNPVNSRGGTFTDDEGVVRFNSYGSMTYAGMLSMIYANLDRSDPRVKSAADWAVHRWTLDENPGTGQEGIFYYYNVLSKGLAAYGQDQFIRENGETLNWRTEVAEKLLALQRIDQGKGYWLNEVGRYMESDPILVTSYSLIALQIALGQ